jgi:hypothetical protein
MLQSFPWYGYDEKIYTFTKLHVVRGVIETEAYGIAWWLLGNLGMRLIGIVVLLFFAFKEKKRGGMFLFMLLLMTSISLIIPLFFIQTGRVFEIVQMIWYFLFFCSLFAGAGLGILFSKPYPIIIKVILVIVLVGLTIPSATQDYTELFSVILYPHQLSEPQFQTMQFLAKQQTYDATILEIPPQGTKLTDKGLSDWYNKATPFVTAFGNKQSYFTNQFQDVPDVIKKEKLEDMKSVLQFVATPVSDKAFPQREARFIKFLQEHKIHFIYSQYPITQFTKTKGITSLYNSGQNFLYQIDN